MPEFIRSKEKDRILEQLEKQHEISKIPFLLIKSGKEKIRAYSGSLSKDEISNLADLVRIENIGLYFSSIHENEIRLSLDACHLLQDEIKKNMLELDDKQAELWFKGQDIEIENKDAKGFVVLKHEEDIIGVGKLVGNIVKNFMPKERRVKS